MELILKDGFTGDDFHKASLAQEYYNLKSKELPAGLQDWILSCAAAELEHKMNLGDKQIFYLEAFVVKFMSSYKKYLEKSLADF